jgi:hypothetical protein
MRRLKFKMSKSSLQFVKHSTMMLMNCKFSLQSPFRFRKKSPIFITIMRIRMRCTLECKDTQKAALKRSINLTV